MRLCVRSARILAVGARYCWFCSGGFRASLGVLLVLFIASAAVSIHGVQNLLAGSATKLDPRNIGLSEIFNEQHEPAFSGIFKIQATRLNRKDTKE